MNLRNKKFKEIAERRMTRIFQSLNSFSKLSSKNYDYSEDEINEIFNSLIENGEKCKNIFYKNDDNFSPNFNFKTCNSTYNDKNIKFRELSLKRLKIGRAHV